MKTANSPNLLGDAETYIISVRCGCCKGLYSLGNSDTRNGGVRIFAGLVIRIKGAVQRNHDAHLVLDLRCSVVVHRYIHACTYLTPDVVYAQQSVWESLGLIVVHSQTITHHMLSC